MSIETVVKELAEFNDNYKKVRADFVEQLRPQFSAAFDQFFNENPNVGGVQWTQYTPYFNDGDECIFRVNDMYLFPAGTDLDDLDYDDCSFPYLNDVEAYKTLLETGQAPADYRSYYSNESFLRTYGVTREQYILDEAERVGINPTNVEVYIKTLEDWDTLAATLGSIDDDVYKDIFGDHVKVVVTRNGINVDEYDHD